MKSVIISCLLSAALAAPFVARQSNQAIIQMKTGDGDASVQVPVTLDSLFSTASKCITLGTPYRC